MPTTTDNRHDGERLRTTLIMVTSITTTARTREARSVAALAAAAAATAVLLHALRALVPFRDDNARRAVRRSAQRHVVCRSAPKRHGRTDRRARARARHSRTPARFRKPCAEGRGGDGDSDGDGVSRTFARATSRKIRRETVRGERCRGAHYCQAPSAVSVGIGEKARVSLYRRATRAEWREGERERER